MACLASKTSAFDKVPLLRLCISTNPDRLERVWELFWRKTDHVDFKFKFNAQTAVEGFRIMQAQLQGLESWDNHWKCRTRSTPMSAWTMLPRHSYHNVQGLGVRKRNVGFAIMWFLTKNVGAGDGTEHMEILIEWRDENEVPHVVLRTVLQDWKNSFGIFWLCQDVSTLWFLNKT